MQPGVPGGPKRGGEVGAAHACLRSSETDPDRTFGAVFQREGDGLRGTRWAERGIGVEDPAQFDTVPFPGRPASSKPVNA